MSFNLSIEGYTLYAMVHKLKDGSGGPARVLALPSSRKERYDSPNSFSSNKGNVLASSTFGTSLLLLAVMNLI